jgi:amino acid transporter
MRDRRTTKLPNHMAPLFAGIVIGIIAFGIGSICLAIDRSMTTLATVMMIIAWAFFCIGTGITVVSFMRERSRRSKGSQ